jgi:hypothetical protein
MSEAPPSATGADPWRIATWDRVSLRGSASCEGVGTVEFAAADIDVVDPIVGEPVSAKLKVEGGRLMVVKLAASYRHLAPEYAPLVAGEPGSTLVRDRDMQARRVLATVPPVHELAVVRLDAERLRLEARAPADRGSWRGALLGHLELESPSFVAIVPTMTACWLRLCTEYERRVLAALHCDLGEDDLALAIAEPQLPWSSIRSEIRFAVGDSVIWLPAGPSDRALSASRP